MREHAQSSLTCQRLKFPTRCCDLPGPLQAATEVHEKIVDFSPRNVSGQDHAYTHKLITTSAHNTTTQRFEVQSSISPSLILCKRRRDPQKRARNVAWPSIWTCIFTPMFTLPECTSKGLLEPRLGNMPKVTAVASF